MAQGGSVKHEQATGVYSRMTDRRDSVSSNVSQVMLDRGKRSLNDIHSSASQSSTLTSFNDYGAPPALSDNKGVQGYDGVQGSLYSRLRASVGPYSPRETFQGHVATSSIDSQSKERRMQNESARPRSAQSGSLEPSTPRQTGMRSSRTPSPTPTVEKKSFREQRELVRRELSETSTTKSLTSGNRGPQSTEKIEKQSASLAEPLQPTSFSTAKSGPVTTKSSSRGVTTTAQNLAVALNRGRANSEDIISSPDKSKLSTGSDPLRPQLAPNRLDRNSIERLVSRTAESSSRTPGPLQEGPEARRAITAASSSGTASPSRRSLLAIETVRNSSPASVIMNKDVQPSASPMPNDLIYQMQHKVLSKDFWMKDENAKVCFSCGDSFTTFRRKHHCRLCGQIYCNACTSQISGKPFGKSNKLRVCKTCNNMLHEDDSSDGPDDDELLVTPHVRQIRFSDHPNQVPTPDRKKDQKHISTQSPVAKGRNLPPKRLDEIGRAVTISDGDHIHTLARPASSRSLKTLSTRPRSSSHKSRRPRSQHMRSLSIGPESGGILRRRMSGDRDAMRPLGASITDSLVDPELHPFLSDDESSDDDAPTIASTLGHADQDASQVGFQGIMHAIRKARPRASGVPMVEGYPGRAFETASAASSKAVQTRRKTLARSMSAGSVTNFASSRLGKSDNLFKSSDNLYTMLRDTGANTRLGLIAHDDDDFADSPTRVLPAAELNQASLRHLKSLLRQFLRDNNVPHSRKWELALLPVLLQCAGNVDPNIQRGDRIDIRTYIKIKKIAGGVPRDTSLVDGLVFTNSVALRDMSRRLRNPRILLISFPLIYARHQQHFMSLEGVVAQEAEYLRNLSLRIIKLKPDLVLVQGEVAGVVRNHLHKAGITVVHDVKASVIQAAARFLQTRIVSSVDKLTMEKNQLGLCRLFQAKSYVHGNSKRSYIYISGCPSDLGCTIIIRGADTKVLKKLKWITEFLAYVAYNLKLETCLMKDQFGETEPPEEKICNPQNGNGGTHWQYDDIARRGKYEDIMRYLKDRILSASPSVVFPEPYLLRRGLDQEGRMAQFDQLQKQDPGSPAFDEKHEEPPAGKFELIRPDMVHGDAKNRSKQIREVLRAIHTAEFERAAHSYYATKRRWDAYLTDVVEPFSPLTHQKIVVQHSIISNATSDACIGPELAGFEYYQEHDVDEGWERDMPLGEYIERLCGQADSGCTAGRCDSRMLDHHRQYVHGKGQVTLHMKRCPSRFEGMDNTILMWSRCRTCQFETQVAPMSAEAWKYSFGKYLEVSFWGLPLRPQSSSCTHDINRHHDRCFGFRRLCVQVRYSDISLVEVIVPRSTISWDVNKDLTQKNELYERIEQSITRYMTSVKLRLKSIKLQSIVSDKVEQGSQEVEALSKRADGELNYLMRDLREMYLSSRYYEVVPMNRALRSLQEKVAEWDTAFADFEAKYIPSGKDLRRLAAIQFRKAFLEKEGPLGLAVDGEMAPEKVTNNSDVTSPLDEKINIALQGPMQVSNGIDNDARITDVSPPSPALQGDLVQSLDLATSPANLSQSISTTQQARRSLPVPDELSPDRQAAQAGMSPSQDLKSDAHPAPRPSLSTNAASPSRASTSPAVPQARASGHAHPQAERLVPEGAPSMSDAHLPAPLVRTTAQASGTDRSSTPTIKIGNIAVQSLIPRAVANRKPNDSSRVSVLAKHFEQMSREFERDRLRERRQRLARTRQSRAFPTASAKPILEIIRDAHEAVRDREPLSSQIVSQTADLPLGEQPTDSRLYDQVLSDRPWIKQQADNESLDTVGDVDHSEESTFVQSYPSSEAEGPATDLDIATVAKQGDMHVEGQVPTAEILPDVAKHDTTIFHKILSSLWSERTAIGWTKLDYPLTPIEHVFADSDLMIREDEPSSLIAFALALPDYVRKMQRFRDRAKAAEHDLATEQDTANGSEDLEVENVLLGKTATHMSFRFDDGPARLQCKVFFAESFDAIRRKCGVADRFIESLSRSLKLDTKGGKSKSLFMQTHDKRFILKSLTMVEVSAFLKFAPDYFDFQSKCLFHALPSSLAKMLGLYQVVIKNPTTGMEFNWFLQVIENVFYEGEPTRKFDLKGSMRNRKAEVTGLPNEVLLDENFLDFISHDPLHVRYHSSALLNNSITNDTLFCSKQNVMDYSLIIGLYEEKKEVVVGIIDYIRTYTWDKKLETWIKDRGSRKATIRSPKEYRARFRRSIPTYFPHAPSVWQVFGTTPHVESGPLQIEENEGSNRTESEQLRIRETESELPVSILEADHLESRTA